MTRERSGGRHLWLTCAVDGADHAISDAAFLAARGDGSYLALCRAVVWAASLSSPPAGRCPTCATAAAEPTEPGATGERPAGRRWPRLAQRPSA